MGGARSRRRPDQGPGARPGQYTVEGQVLQLGDFARGLLRVRGRGRWAARAFLGVLLLMAFSLPITFAITLLTR